ncbi:MAG: C-GCAxxG-C-C family (seleno)protein [Candidatus Omnitrophica bacterium]|nr:C-GCAxxG-C-C family (seleno)protein [Candidatus Omnitrophota bacterium]MDD5042444.1 C-GCAxxG-C-C family (seleno)protein [Candidatus Omnitrophota bacterium]MDD5501165.1 C-GCAxxG-C-C family (seleno)protein [Candidatus Omnitrophota bacterium]
MISKKAKNNFLGINGRRYNCAQSVIEACSGFLDLSCADLEAHAGHGGGRAPGGYCGALHAALSILQIYRPEKAGELKKFFLEQSGALTCKEIKSAGKTPCVSCVENAAGFLGMVFRGEK